MKKHIGPMLCALGISTSGLTGLYCLLNFFSCFMDGSPSRYPVAFPASILGGLLCLAAFVACCYGYIRLRKKAPSLLWTVVDVALALALLAAGVLCFLNSAPKQVDPYRVQIRVVDDGTAEPAGDSYPCDLYYGLCGDGVLELRQKYVGDPVVDVEVVGFSVNHNADTHFGSEGSITVKLLSKRNQKVKVWVKGYQSDDNGASLEGKDLTLKAGKPEELAVGFEGWSKLPYYVSVEVILAGESRWDSRMEIAVHPTKSP